MSKDQIEGVFGIWIIGTILCCLSTGIWVGDGFTGVIQGLASFHAERFTVGGGITIPTGVTAYWNALVTLLYWEYPFLASSWCLFIKIPLWIISAGVVVGLIQMAIYVLSALVGIVRSIFGY
jgi:hypothetical protein